MGRKMEFVGVVSSDKMDKTVVVTVESLEKHPIFKKYIRRRKTFKAHDEKNECRQGDKVLIRQCRPLSKDKSWRVVNILEKQE
jgi:small subunit ribosomal protein S17